MSENAKGKDKKLAGKSSFARRGGVGGGFSKTVSVQRGPIKFAVFESKKPKPKSVWSSKQDDGGRQSPDADSSLASAGGHGDSADDPCIPQARSASPEGGEPLDWTEIGDDEGMDFSKPLPGMPPAAAPTGIYRPGAGLRPPAPRLKKPEQCDSSTATDPVRTEPGRAGKGLAAKPQAAAQLPPGRAQWGSAALPGSDAARSVRPATENSINTATSTSNKEGAQTVAPAADSSGETLSSSAASCSDAQCQTSESPEDSPGLCPQACPDLPYPTNHLPYPVDVPPAGPGYPVDQHTPGPGYPVPEPAVGVHHDPFRSPRDALPPPLPRAVAEEAWTAAPRVPQPLRAVAPPRPDHVRPAEAPRQPLTRQAAPPPHHPVPLPPAGVPTVDQLLAASFDEVKAEFPVFRKLMQQQPEARQEAWKDLWGPRTSEGLRLAITKRREAGDFNQRQSAKSLLQRPPQTDASSPKRRPPQQQLDPCRRPPAAAHADDPPLQPPRQPRGTAPPLPAAQQVLPKEKWQGPGGASARNSKAHRDGWEPPAPDVAQKKIAEFRRDRSRAEDRDRSRAEDWDWEWDVGPDPRRRYDGRRSDGDGYGSPDRRRRPHDDRKEHSYRGDRWGERRGHPGHRRHP